MFLPAYRRFTPGYLCPEPEGPSTSVVLPASSAAKRVAVHRARIRERHRAVRGSGVCVLKPAAHVAVVGQALPGARRASTIASFVERDQRRICTSADQRELALGDGSLRPDRTWSRLAAADLVRTSTWR